MTRKHVVKVQTSQMLALRDIFHRRILNHRYIFHLSVQHSFPTYSFFFQHSKINLPPTKRCYERTPVRPSIFFLNLYKTLSRHLVSSDVDAIDIHFRCDLMVSTQRVVYFSHQSDRLGYVSRTNQIAAFRVCISH